MQIRLIHIITLVLTVSSLKRESFNHLKLLVSHSDLYKCCRSRARTTLSVFITSHTYDNNHISVNHNCDGLKIYRLLEEMCLVDSK